MEWCANAAHKVFDTWSEPGTQLGSEGNHAQHMFDTIPNPQGRVLHVLVHQYQPLVSPDLLSQVFSAYGTVEEMFHSPHQDSPTHTSSIFIEYAHASMADDALHGLHGLYLYQDDCQLEIRHANNCELQAFYGYSAPSFSQEQLELLQQIKTELQALSQNGTFGLVDVCLGTDLEPTPPSQNNLSVAIPPISACESFRTEDKQAEQKCKNQEKQLKHAPVQLQLDLENFLLPAISIFAEDANEDANTDTFDQVLQQWPMKQHHPQDSSNTTTVTLAQDILLTHDDKAQNDAQLVKSVAEESSILQNTQPYAMTMKKQIEAHITSYIPEIEVAFPLLHEEEVRTTQTDMLPSADVLTVKVVAEEPYNSQTAHINCKIISDLCGHITTSPLMLPWDPGTLHCIHWEVSMPINKGKFSCLQLVLLWFTMHYTVIHSTYLICLCTSMPWEDPGAIHALQLIDSKWTPSALVSIFRKLKLPDICKVPKQYEKQLASTFNEVQLLAVASPRQELLYQAGENSQCKSITWKSETLDNFLLFLTKRVHSIYLVLPWDPGVQQQHLSGPCQIMRRKEFASSLASQFDNNCIPQRNPKCEILCDIQLVVLTVWHYSFSSSEMVMLLGISSCLECYSVVGDALVQLNHHFISDLESKINLLQFAHFMIVVSRQYSDKHAGIDYLQGIISQLGDVKESEDWHMNEQGHVYMMLVVCLVVSLPYKITIHYIRELNSKCAIFWAGCYQLPKAAMAIVDLAAVRNGSAILASVMIIQYSSRNEVQALEIAIKLYALLLKPMDTVINSSFLQKILPELIAQNLWGQGQGTQGSEIHHRLLLFFRQNVPAFVQLVKPFDARKSMFLGAHKLIECYSVIYISVLRISHMQFSCCEQDLSLHLHEYILTMITNASFLADVVSTTYQTVATGWLTADCTKSIISDWKVLQKGMPWISASTATWCGVIAVDSASQYGHQVIVFIKKSHPKLLLLANSLEIQKQHYHVTLQLVVLNIMLTLPLEWGKTNCTLVKAHSVPSLETFATSHKKLQQQWCIEFFAVIQRLQFSTMSCSGMEQYKELAT